MSSSPSLSILIPTIDETNSLAETVHDLFSEPSLNICEVLIITGENTTQSTLKACRGLEATYGERVRTIKQFLPHLGGAFRSGIDAAAGSRIVLMFSDLESDPHVVPALVSAAEVEPSSIISASRWLRKRSFIGYGPAKLILNYCFQRLCALICQHKLTDFTYGFRLYPSSILKSNHWEETDHAFVLESILKPLFDGVRVREVAAVWTARREGNRRSRFRQYLQYIPTLLGIIIAYHHHKQPAAARLAGSVRSA